MTFIDPFSKSNDCVVRLRVQKKGKGKGKATLFIHGLCLKLEPCGAVYMKQILNKHNMIKNPNWQYKPWLNVTAA